MADLEADPSVKVVVFQAIIPISCVLHATE